MGSPHWFVLTGTRGARERAQLLAILADRPGSVKQLSDALGLEYATVQQHLAVLEKNDIVQGRQRDGVIVYQPTPKVRQDWDTVSELLEDTIDAEAEEPMQMRTS